MTRMSSASASELDSESPVSTSPPGSISIGNGPLGAPPSGKINWPKYWPLPVAGMIYLGHLRYRRSVPRRLPALTSMSLRELYATNVCLVLTALEVERLKVHMIQDKDLLTIDIAALRLRDMWHVHRDLYKTLPSFQNPRARDIYFSFCARENPDLLHELRWHYNHMWSDTPSWNFSMLKLHPVVIDLGYLEEKKLPHCDIDICITHLANTSAIGYKTFWIASAIPFGKLLYGVTPLAMLARWAGPRILRLTLNGIQRALVYTTASLAAAQSYQHFAYPTTLEDKHGVAEMLRLNFPGLDREVEDASRELSEGMVIVWPGPD
ncbi:hypothetical protein OH76DRAFT_1408427 [Lentinus brumalis]|uniref:Uncharacterized protein n=1 Tax=Lentinus brumalis TaxID=2498619 RepID=A0A371CXI8_9APHY|nr:hypothetical protein OH76DRAFT_1408427 [Polyporus brumalis]